MNLDDCENQLSALQLERKFVHLKLTDYRNLILYSDGEYDDSDLAEEILKLEQTELFLDFEIEGMRHQIYCIKILTRYAQRNNNGDYVSNEY